MSKIFFYLLFVRIILDNDKSFSRNFCLRLSFFHDRCRHIKIIAWTMASTQHSKKRVCYYYDGMYKLFIYFSMFEMIIYTLIIIFKVDRNMHHKRIGTGQSVPLSGPQKAAHACKIKLKKPMKFLWFTLIRYFLCIWLKISSIWKIISLDFVPAFWKSSKNFYKLWKLWKAVFHCMAYGNDKF